MREERLRAPAFSKFVDQLIAQGLLRTGLALCARAAEACCGGGTLEAPNKGGEDHTFTEVANFGGGCIDFLNGLLGLVPRAGVRGLPWAAPSGQRWFRLGGR